MDKGKAKNFRWAKFQTHDLLRILAEEVALGNKPAGMFKQKSYKRVADEISQKYDCCYTTTNVINGVKTLKSVWRIISALKANSGFGWDDTEKMVTAGPEAYEEYVKAHPEAEKYLNKKIECYNELSIVVGKDLATGEHSRSFADTEEADKESSAESPRSSRSSGRKRKYKDGDYLSDLSGVVESGLSEIADAVRLLAHMPPPPPPPPPHVIHDPREELDKRLTIAIEELNGYSTSTMERVIEILFSDDRAARAFLHKSKDMRRMWIENYVEKK